MIRGDTLIRDGRSSSSPILDSGPIINPTKMNKAPFQAK
jgi:hypothetical protein